MILTLAVVIVKIVGALYKLPMLSIITEDGSGFYSTAYNLYLTIYSIAVTGFPVAVSRIVAKYVSEGRYRDVKRVFRVSSAAFALLGVVSTAALMLLARPYVESIENPHAFWCVLAVAPSLLFSCLMSTHRGYNQGLKNMTPTAVSQVVEVLFKAGCGLAFSYYLKSRCINEFLASGTVFGSAMPDAATADVITASYAAAGAILGVSISTFAGWLYLFVRRMFVSDGITHAQVIQSPRAHSNGYQIRQICRVVFPIALSAATVTLTGLIDNYSVLDRLRTVIESDLATLYASHGGWLEQAEKAVEHLPNYLYGVYNLGITIFNLVPALTGSFGMSALPHVTGAWIAKDKTSVKTYMESTLRMTTLIAAPIGFGISFLAGPIADLLYGNSMPVGSKLLVPILSVLGVAAIFVAIVNPLNALLQAIGKLKVPVYLMIVGGVVKLACNYFLVAIPEFNIKATPTGNLMCYFVITVLSVIVLIRVTKIKLSLSSVFLKPLFAGLMCGVFALLSYNVFTRFLPQISDKLLTVAAIAVGALVYLIVLGVTKALNREDILGLPGGRKISVLLEKVKLLR